MKSNEIALAIDYSDLPPGSIDSLIAHVADDQASFAFRPVAAFSLEAAKRLRTSGAITPEMEKGIVYEKQGGVSEAESAVMNIAALLDVDNNKEAILEAISRLQARLTRYAQYVPAQDEAVHEFVDGVAKILNISPDHTYTELLTYIAALKDAVYDTKPPAGEEHVRVLRVIEYTGPRRLVEEQVRRSVHGTRRGISMIAGDEYHLRKQPCMITAVTVNEYPEILEQAKTPPPPPTPPIPEYIGPEFTNEGRNLGDVGMSPEPLDYTDDVRAARERESVPEPMPQSVSAPEATSADPEF